MAYEFKILRSSSAGNCALITTNSCKVLIDAGLSARRLEKILVEEGESIDTIDAVFLTHEHTDHAAGIRGLAQREHLHIFANRDTAEAVQHKLKRRPNWRIFENGGTFRYKDIEVTPFSIPHDAYDPVGFVFEVGEDTLFEPRRRIAWVTDLGYVPELVRQRVQTADLLVLEANYEPSLLEECTSRPWSSAVVTCSRRIVPPIQTSTGPGRTSGAR